MYVLTPFTAQVDFVEIPKPELREFFHRFVGALPERTALLVWVVNADEGFASWAPDTTPASLEALGAWFMANVHTRPKTEAEIFAESARIRYDLDIPRITLTDRTFSLAADIGGYFAEVLMRLHPELRWTLPLGSKNFVDYGQPVLKGFRAGVTLNPVRIATNVAWGASRGKPDAYRLRQLLDVWSSHVEPKSDGPTP